MNIKRAKQEIKNAIEAYLLKDDYGNYEIPVIRQRPVLLIGPPGVGKTQIMEQISQECGIGLVAYTITHHTRQSAIGLPYIQEKEYDDQKMSVTEYTMSEIIASIYNKIEATGLKEGILFIDEINCVSETLAPTMLQFLQCKTFGTHSIPEGWVIVAAGNPPEYNKSVREFDIVTLDRIKMIHVEPDLAVWKEYAQQVQIHPAIQAYLDVKEENFCQIETTVDGKRFATPRGWEDLSRLIEVYEKLKKTVDRDVVFQYIQHARIAKDFANYLELYYKYQRDYKIDEILEGVIRESACDKLAKAPFDERLSVMSLLLTKLNDGFRNVVKAEARMEQLQQLFGGVKPGTYDESKYESALDRMEEIFVGAQEDWKYKKKAGLLNRQEDYLMRDVLKVLEETVRSLKLEDRRSAEQVWEKVSQVFGELNDQYEQLFDTCGEHLEHGFDFMEAAFENSQEMVVFMTGLNTGFYSVKFLQEYECERYYQYNRDLLFEGQEREILQKIENRI